MAAEIILGGKEFYDYNFINENLYLKYLLNDGTIVKFYKNLENIIIYNEENLISILLKDFSLFEE